MWAPTSHPDVARVSLTATCPPSSLRNRRTSRRAARAHCLWKRKHSISQHPDLGWRSVGQGHVLRQTGERTAPGAPSLFSRFLFSVLEMIFKLTLLLKGGNLCFCLWEYFLKYHVSELLLLILTCTYPGSHFAMFMISEHVVP